MVEALFNLNDQLTTWPNSRKRLYESILEDEREGFIGAMGKFNRTDTVLKSKPGAHFNVELFFT